MMCYLVMVFRYSFSLVEATNGPWVAKNGTLVATVAENRSWVNDSYFLDYAHMK